MENTHICTTDCFFKGRLYHSGDLATFSTEDAKSESVKSYFRSLKKKAKEPEPKIEKEGE